MAPGLPQRQEAAQQDIKCLSPRQIDSLTSLSLILTKPTLALITSTVTSIFSLLFQKVRDECYNWRYIVD